MTEPQSELLGMLRDQLERLLGGMTGEDALARWADFEALGLPLALVPEDKGGSGLGWSAFAAIAAVLGAKATAAPLGETMLANWLLAEAGLEPAEGPVALMLEDDSGTAPWGRAAKTAVGYADETSLVQISAGDLSWTPAQNAAGEPRDRTNWPGAAAGAPSAPCAARRWEAKLAAALLRSGQMAGALGQALALSIEYANVRVQFGRPIGKFQAVQHMIAELAGEAAAATAGVEASAQGADGEGLTASAHRIAGAKIRAGMAAGKGAALAQQVHGAMGFTEEYPLGLVSRRLWAWRDEMGSQKEWSAWLGRQAMTAPSGLWPFLSESGETP